MKYAVAFFEAFDEEERMLRSLLPPDLECFFTWKTIQESGFERSPAPIVSVRTQSLLPTDWAGEIDALVTRSTGYDHVTEFLEGADSEIAAAYLPDYAGRAVAEQAMLLWSALLRKLELQRSSFDSFHRDELTGRELVARKLTVVGVGRIGSQVVDLAQGLKMDVVGVDVAPRGIRGLKYVSLAEGVARAEILVCALPLTDETRGLLDYELLKTLPPGAILVNIARGEITPTRDVLKLLRNGILSGAGLDVYEHEKELAAVLRDGVSVDDMDDPAARESVEAALELRSRNDVILTPHNAFNTVESVERKSEQTVANLLKYIKSGTFITPVPEFA